MKMFFRTGLWGLVVAGAALFSRAAAGDTIIHNASDYTTYTYGNPWVTTIDAGSLNIQPYAHIDAIAGLGSDASTSTTTFDFTDSRLNITTEQKRDDTLTALTGASGTVIFHVEADMHYSLSGSFKVNDIDDTKAGESYLFASLYDDDTNKFLFSNVQATDGIADSSFNLGETGGTLLNSLSGNLTGTLEAGHTDFFSSKAYTQSLAPNAGATANGNFNLDIVETPEPGIVWAGGALLGALLLKTMWSRRDKTASQA